MTPAQLGERQHETCRFGSLTPAWMVGAGGLERPTCIPLCGWRPPENAPPGLARAWGGAVEYDRDCAVCQAHQPVDAEVAA